MIRKVILCMFVMLLAFGISSCKGEMKEVTCDGCGKLVTVEADSNMNDDWIVFCEECGEPEIVYDK